MLERRVIHRDILCLLILCALSGRSSFAQESLITVKLRGKPEDTSARYNTLDLYVNGNKLGSVSPGRDVVLKLIPTDSASYTFWMQSQGWLNGNEVIYRSKLIDISAKPGDTIIASTQVTQGFPLIISLHLTLVVPPPLRVLSAQLLNQYVEKELSRETVMTPRGAKRTIKRTRSFERFVSVAATGGLESSFKFDLAAVATEIRSKLDVAVSRSSRETETIEQTIEIDGSVLPRVALAWVEKRQTGMARASVNGAATLIPFELVKSLELRVVPLPN